MKSVDGRIQVLELDQPPFLPLFIPLAPAQPPVSISLYRCFFRVICGRDCNTVRPTLDYAQCC